MRSFELISFVSLRTLRFILLWLVYYIITKQKKFKLVTSHFLYNNRKQKAKLNQFYCNQVKLKDKTDEKKFVGILLETIFTTNSKKKKASESEKNKILYTFQVFKILNLGHLFQIWII